MIRPQYPTTITLTAATTSLTFNQQPMLIATVSPTPAGGSMGFLVDGQPLYYCADQPVVGGVATCTPPSGTSLAIGTHNLRASYAGDGVALGNTSPPLGVRVRAATDTSVSASLSSASKHQSVTFTATVAAFGYPATIPTGKVVFVSDGNMEVGMVMLTKLNANTGQAIVTTPLPSGTHAITARYEGDGTSAISSSPPITVVAQ